MFQASDSVDLPKGFLRSEQEQGADIRVSASRFLHRSFIGLLGVLLLSSSALVLADEPADALLRDCANGYKSAPKEEATTYICEQALDVIEATQPNSRGHLLALSYLAHLAAFKAPSKRTASTYFRRFIEVAEIGFGKKSKEYKKAILDFNNYLFLKQNWKELRDASIANLKYFPGDSSDNLESRERILFALYNSYMIEQKKSPETFNPHEALNALKDLVAIHTLMPKHANSPISSGWDQLALGRQYVDLGQTEKAREHFTEALKIYKATHYTHLQNAAQTELNSLPK